MKLLVVLIFLVCLDDTEGWFWSRKPKEMQVDFWLYTKNGNNKDTITTSNLASKFVNGAKTIFLIHGYYDQGSASWMHILKDELLTSSGSLNVIIVNWKDGASEFYGQSVKNARKVGDKTGDIIKAIKEKKGVPYSKFYIIGHSLGAHCAGFSGQRVTELTGEKIGRISGLDVAGLHFVRKNDDEKLSIDDADFVDVMHTDDGILLSLSFGYLEGRTIGHVDFYPNGGKYQPGCSFFKIGCSHSIATDYFTNSINKCQYKSYRCPDGTVLPGVKMGYHSSTSLRGKYCLETASKEPYCEI